VKPTTGRNGDTLEIGYVARAHGTGGELAVKMFDPGSRTLEKLERIRLVSRAGEASERRVEAVRFTPKETLLRLQGVTDRSAADSLRGATILAFREDVPGPSEGEYFQGDLVGLAVQDEQGLELGLVEELWSTGPVPVLVIRSSKGEELLLPFADDFVLSVDLKAQRLTVRLPEYME
jgi:16S rRNA processing protein RimM